MAKWFFEAHNEVPDGTQCHRKAYITTALGSLCSIIGSAYSITHNPAEPCRTLEAVARVGRFTFTAAAVRAMFGLTTCVSAQVREKPDGCEGGLTLGACTQSYETAAIGCVYMGTATALFKIGKLEAWGLFATPKV